jgi:hypothetical protein
MTFGHTWALLLAGTPGVRYISSPVDASLPERLRRKLGVAEKVGLL